MKTQSLRSISVLFAIVILSVETQAADTNKLLSSFRVKVTVGGSDNIKNAVSSYLNRELRSLNDVELVDTDPELELQVLVTEITTVGGHNSGVAISTLIIFPYGNEILSAYFRPERKDEGLKLSARLCFYPTHWLNVASTDGVQQVCKNIINDFDTLILEERRMLYRQIRESIKKSE